MFCVHVTSGGLMSEYLKSCKNALNATEEFSERLCKCKCFYPKTTRIRRYLSFLLDLEYICRILLKSDYRQLDSNEFEMKCVEVIDSDGQKWNEAGSQFQRRQEYITDWYELMKNYYPTCT